MRWPSVLVFSTIAVAGIGCAQQQQIDSNTVQLLQLYETLNCGRYNKTPVLTQLVSKDELSAFFSDVQSLGLPESALPDVDFDSDTLVLVQLGERSNTGFGIKITAETAEVVSGQLTLPVLEFKPSADGYYNSMLVSPCVLFKFSDPTVKTVAALGLTLELNL